VNQQLASIRQAFLDIGRELEPYGEKDYRRGDEARFRPVFEQINKLAGQDVDESDVEVLARDRELAAAFERINLLRSTFGPRLEVGRAEQVISASDPWEALAGFIFHPNYLELARMETRGAGLQAGDRVVFLGSGPLPLSCITMCAGHGVFCTGVERELELVELSRRAVERLGLADRLRIVHGDHRSLPLDDKADLTMVASAAEPKAEIFQHLAEVLPAGAKVSYRIHEKGLRRLINSPCLQAAPPGFREIGRVQPRPPVINTCVFAEKA
jgi:hypothetical protein